MINNVKVIEGMQKNNQEHANDMKKKNKGHQKKSSVREKVEYKRIFNIHTTGVSEEEN